MLGAWVSYTLAQLDLPWLGISLMESINQDLPPIWVPAVILVASMAFCSLIGFAIERLAYKPLRKAPRLNVLITAIGVSLLLQNVGQLNAVFGRNPQKMPTRTAELSWFGWQRRARVEPATW